MTRQSRDMLYGSVDMLILRTLTWKPMHGYQIATWIEENTDGVLVVEDAALYKALHRLEQQEFIAGEWGVTEGNRRAKFYELTPAGKRALRAEWTAWKAYANAMHQLLEPT
jgi:PadR family transcriptional regulator, regulatory protein PadR